MSPLIGTALDRVDGPRKVTGAARYAAENRSRTSPTPRSS